MAGRLSLHYGLVQTGLFRGAASESEDEQQGLVERAELTRVEAPGGATEALWIDDRRLLDENTRLLAIDRDRQPKARRAGARRRRRDEDRAEVEELIRLDDDGVASPALFVAARASRRGQAEDLAADTSVGERWSELGQLLPDDPHLLAIALVGGQASDLVAKCRAHTAPRGRLPKRSTHGLGVGQPVAPDDLERRCRCLVEPNVKRTCHKLSVVRVVLREGPIEEPRRSGALP